MDIFRRTKASCGRRKAAGDYLVVNFRRPRFDVVKAVVTHTRPTGSRAAISATLGSLLANTLSCNWVAALGLRCSYTPILPTKRPKRSRIADDGKYIEKFFRHPFSFVRGD